MGVENVTHEIYGLMFNQLTLSQIIVREYGNTLGWIEKSKGVWEFFPEEDIKTTEVIDKLIMNKVTVLNKEL